MDRIARRIKQSYCYSLMSTCRGSEVDRHATSTCNDYIAQNQFIHFCPEKTIQCFLRLADHRLVLIKGRVEYHRYARQIAEAFDQLVISWIGRTVVGQSHQHG